MATPSTQSNSVQAGLGNLGAGIARAMDNRYQAQKDAQAQANWEKTQANWEKSFAQQKALQDLQMRQLQAQMDRQKEQDEWLKKFYEAYFGDDPEYQELLQLRKMFAGKEDESDTGDSTLTLMGLGPLFRR